MILDTYLSMNQIELNLTKQSLLLFYLDTRVKVSVLLRELKQLANGHFIISQSGVNIAYKVNAPGRIQMYSKVIKLFKTHVHKI